MGNGERFQAGDTFLKAAEMGDPWAMYMLAPRDGNPCRYFGWPCKITGTVAFRKTKNPPLSLLRQITSTQNHQSGVCCKEQRASNASPLGIQTPHSRILPCSSNQFPTNSPNRLIIVPFTRTIKSNNAQLSTNKSFDKIIFIVTYGALLLLTC